MNYEEMTAKELKVLADEKNFSYAKNANQAKMIELHTKFDELKALKEKDEKLDEGIEEMKEAGLDTTEVEKVNKALDEKIEETEEELGIKEDETVTIEEVQETLEEVEKKLDRQERKPKGIFKGKCPLTGKELFA